MKRIPKILLIGAGRFGKNHLRVLRLFERQGRLVLAGVAVSGTPLTPALLKSVDAVDIVTPYKTHFSLAKKCLRYTNVFVEKPLAETFAEAKWLSDYAQKQKRILMVGHIYRYHPATEKLKSLLKKFGRPKSISGSFISPIATYRQVEDPLLEELHFFDVLDYLFGEKPEAIWGTGPAHIKNVSLRYPNGVDAHFKIGWQEDKKIRMLNFEMPGGKKIVCDFTRRTAIEPLERELMTFIDILRGKKVIYPDGEAGVRIVGIAEQAKKSSASEKPRVAVIGGGIFGATSALLLGKYFNVALFEKNPDIFGEATFANQYRHHYGFHYPRSVETIKEIAEARKDFESFYKQAIFRPPSYYCVSKSGSMVSSKDYLQVYAGLGILYQKKYPPAEFLNRDMVSLCIRTPEAVYDYKKLKNFVWRKLRGNPKIKIKLSSEVLSARIGGDGKKILAVRSKNCKKEKLEFDYVVNATYANYNNFCGWLGFPEKNLRFRLKEIILLKLKTKNKCAVTIVDGPFATILPTDAAGDIYTLGDVPLSVHRSATGIKSASVADARWGKPQSRWKKIIKRCSRWFPQVKNADYAGSMFVVLPTEVASDATDSRPTVVTNHGFGCFSIFSGKILTCVSSAKKILFEIQDKKHV